MGAISMVMFDLSRTTVEDGTGVQDCLYEAAQSLGVAALLGVNKIHLFQYLIERSQGNRITIEEVDFLEQAGSRFSFHEIVTHNVSLQDVNTGLELAQLDDAIRVAVWPE